MCCAIGAERALVLEALTFPSAPIGLKMTLQKFRDPAENILEGRLVGQVNHPKIALMGVGAEAGSMHYQDAGCFQQVQHKAFICVRAELVRFDHQVEGGLRHVAR